MIRLEYWTATHDTYALTASPASIIYIYYFWAILGRSNNEKLCCTFWIIKLCIVYFIYVNELFSMFNLFGSCNSNDRVVHKRTDLHEGACSPLLSLSFTYSLTDLNLRINNNYFFLYMINICLFLICCVPFLDWVKILIKLLKENQIWY